MGTVLRSVITEMEDAPADADNWREITHQLRYIER